MAKAAFKEVVFCDYCERETKLVTGEFIYRHRPDLASKKFYHCAPCEAYVGVHANSPTFKPMGRLAKAELRSLKMQLHLLFDPLWREKTLSRSAAYKKLADALKIPLNECHIGMFDVERAEKAIAICLEWNRVPA